MKLPEDKVALWLPTAIATTPSFWVVCCPDVEPSSLDVQPLQTQPSGVQSHGVDTPAARVPVRTSR